MAFFTSSNMDVPVIPSDVLKSVPASQKPSRSGSVEEGLTMSAQSTIPVHHSSSASAPVETFSCKPACSQNTPSSPLFSSQPLPHNQNQSQNTCTVLSSSGNNITSKTDKTLCKVDSHSETNSTVWSNPSMESNNSPAHTLSSSTAEKLVITSQVNSEHQNSSRETVVSPPTLPCAGDTVSLSADRTKGLEHNRPPAAPFFLDNRVGEEV